MNQSLTRSDLNNLLEPFVLKKLEDGAYSVLEKDPRCLVSWNRLDIGFKLLYLRVRHNNHSLAKNIYFHDIRSHSMGGFVEPGNSNKSGFDVYCDVFDNIDKCIFSDGFDCSESLIPLASDGSIINGAHRTSVAVYRNKTVTVCETSLPPLVCDYNYFFERAVPIQYLETAVLELIGSGDDFYLAFLWPSGKMNWDESLALFDSVAYRKRLTLTLNGARNLLYECYSHMEWVGDRANNFRGLHQKVTECFPDSFDVELVVFQNRSGIDGVREIKEKIREINGIGFSSIHITDTKDEALRIGSYLLNENGLHHLNYSRPIDLDARSRLSHIKSEIASRGIDLSDVVVDGSYVLELYGLRKSRDLDYIFASSVKSERVSYLDCHDDQLVYHDVDKADLIYNPKYYFEVAGVKFVSLRQIMKMKENRGEGKDRIDVKMIKALHQERRLYKLYLSAKQKMLYAKLKVRRQLRIGLVGGLRAVGLYTTVRRIFRKIKGRET